MKNLVLASVFAVFATAVFSSDISKPLMDPQVVASTVDALPSSYKGLWFVLTLIFIVGTFK